MRVMISAVRSRSWLSSTPESSETPAGQRGGDELPVGHGFGGRGLDAYGCDVFLHDYSTAESSMVQEPIFSNPEQSAPLALISALVDPQK